jgi:hypothetical protein
MYPGKLHLALELEDRGKGEGEGEVKVGLHKGIESARPLRNVTSTCRLHLLWSH